ncbi:hypothetical protein FGIG_00944 [Fasciola gigantica]|uniref:Uncharacterized protein n=1 Tax=Fasciola gigantica TaxID=46835 RepID=A0A504Z6H0_FASGI|nr:hypothetical protein FGIG_00944 [Fasciola gigantica]
MSSDETEKRSSRECETNLHNMPTMDFDKYLLTKYSESPINKDRKRVEIPIYFGVPMIILREKHENELAQGKSFIEIEPPPKHVISALTSRLLLNCFTVEDIEVVLARIKPVVIFHIILELLRRLPEPLVQLSAKSAQVASRILLLKPLHPYDFTITEELYKEILRYHAEQGEESRTRLKRTKHKQDDTIQPLIQKYYNCISASRYKLTKMHNKFNKCIYHDLHTIGPAIQRNLARFIIRNILYLARRYSISYFRRLCQQRSESWSVGRITIQPHIVQYAYTRFAEVVGPVLISQPGVPEYFQDVEKRTMLNILACGMDRMWLLGQKPHDIIVNMEPSYCHANCVCGRGLNLVSARNET